MPARAAISAGVALAFSHKDRAACRRSYGRRASGVAARAGPGEWRWAADIAAARIRDHHPAAGAERNIRTMLNGMLRSQGFSQVTVNFGASAQGCRGRA